MKRFIALIPSLLLLMAVLSCCATDNSTQASDKPAITDNIPITEVQEISTSEIEDTTPIIPSPKPTQTYFPTTVNGGKWSNGHVQGFTIDTAGEYMYFSFTTVLVKTDMQGHVIGTVKGMIGHLGCLEFNDEDGRVYGSLEYKHDSIGKAITGDALAGVNAFYIAMFDVDKITKVGMDAEKDGIMTTVYLDEVVRDYEGKDKNGKDHRYGCSGVDGISIGRIPGSDDSSPSQLLIAYGIYKDKGRTDNDHQVLLCYDWRSFSEVEKTLDQSAPHKSGVSHSEKYFVYTGNTDFGVQNLEFDPDSGDWFMAVYTGTKASFPNYPLYIIDGSKAPYIGELNGRDGETGSILSLKEEGRKHKASGICGLLIPNGSTGMHACGYGLFYFSHESQTDGLHTCNATLYRRKPGTNMGFEPVKEPINLGE